LSSPFKKKGRREGGKKGKSKECPQKSVLCVTNLNPQQIQKLLHTILTTKKRIGQIGLYLLCVQSALIIKFQMIKNVHVSGVKERKNSVSH